MVSSYLVFTSFFYESIRFCMVLVRSQHKNLMNHTSQEWLNGVHLFFSTKKQLYYESIRFCVILMFSQDKDSMNHTSQEWLNGVHLFTFHKKVTFLGKPKEICFFVKSLPPPSPPGGRRRRRRRRKNSPRCPGPCPTTPTDTISP